jgi:hypothetical protein
MSKYVHSNIHSFLIIPYNTSNFLVSSRVLFQMPTRAAAVNGCMDPRLGKYSIHILYVDIYIHMYICIYIYMYLYIIYIYIYIYALCIWMH